ncbi:MAG: aminoglycoside phosphotransferase family protein [Spirochaetales bacterium]|nr:aminoglycoside phosphotransferase family protein [Spirochaetales bacterium]
MYSISKLRLSKSHIRFILKKVLGNTHNIVGITENRDGWFNALYVIETTQGPDLMLKVAPPEHVRVLRYEKNIMKTEVEVLKTLGEVRGVPVPRIYYDDFDRRLLETDFFIMEKLRGVSLGSVRSTLDPAVLEHVDRQKGRINRALNSRTGEQFGLFSSDQPKFATWSEAFSNMMNDILDDAEELSAAIIRPRAQFEELVASQKNLLNAIKTPKLVHWDLHDNNVIINEQNEITGIVDCDRALWGDPVIEVYFSRFMNQSEPFYEGYGEIGRNTPDFQKRRCLYDLYLALIFVTECRSRKITDPGHLDWASSRLREQLEVTSKLFER